MYNVRLSYFNFFKIIADKNKMAKNLNYINIGMVKKNKTLK